MKSCSTSSLRLPDSVAGMNAPPLPMEMDPTPTQNSNSQNLPDTCPASNSNNSQPLSWSASQQLPWGHLYTTNPRLNTLEMVKDEYIIGRAPQCDMVLNQGISMKKLSQISKEHFKIKKVPVHVTGNSNNYNYIVHLHDLSFNGTFVNGTIVGRGKSVVLGHNDNISLAEAGFKVFIFSNSNGDIESNYPKEITGDYAICKKLGSGACGEIMLIFEKCGGKALAMKSIKKDKFQAIKGNIVVKNERNRIEREVNILKALDHPSVVKFEDVVSTDTHVYILMEYMAGGELFNRVRQGPLGESLSKLFFLQLTHAVRYLHERSIIHRDIKPENILLASDELETLIKLADFGLSKFVNPESLMMTFCGTPMYLAPEILKNKGKNASYGKEVDIWSMGVVLYMCLTGSAPFSSDNERATLPQQILEGKVNFDHYLWKNISKTAKSLVKRMLQVNPEERITIEEIVQHAWLKDRGVRMRYQRLIRPPTESENSTETLECTAEFEPAKRIRRV